jgi:hypothetical protein
MKDHRHMHLAIKERQFASEYLAIYDRQIASMSYQTNYSKREYFASHTWEFKFIRNILFLTNVCISY